MRTIPIPARAGHSRRLLVAFLFVLSALTLRAAPVFELVAGFELGPQRPEGGRLILEPDGNLYCVSSAGGEKNAGTIYQLKPDGVVNVLGHLARLGATTPRGSLVADGFGQFWGTTEHGGAADFGIIFKFDVATGTLTRVAEMADLPGYGESGLRAGLARDGTGFLWGTRYAGGSGFLGSVFKVNISTGAVTSLLDFTGTSGANLGSYPTGELIHDGAGYLWGVAAAGGSANCGTVFKIQIATGVLTTVAEFSDAPLAPNRGIGGRGPLMRDAEGNFWGATDAGGSAGFGTIFKVNIATGALTTVADFTGNGPGPQRGAHPQGGLVMDAAGNVWGVTSAGGVNSAGVVFKVYPATALLTPVADFGGSFSTLRGGGASGGLTADRQGRLWGTTEFSDPANVTKYGEDFRGAGTVFRVDPVAETAATIVDWQQGVPGRVGISPFSLVVDDGQGQLWGAVYAGGAYNAGGIYKLDRVTGKATTVRDFTGSGSIYHGVSPSSAQMADDGMGNLWGLTDTYSVPGTIFKIRVSDGAYATVAQFTGNAGAARGGGAKGGLTRDAAGNFWGTTSQGGTAGVGVIFKINIATGVFTNVVDFTGNQGLYPGKNPTGKLARDAAGNFWGATSGGPYSQDNQGTIFKINPVTNEFTTVVQFTGAKVGVARGASPSGVTWDNAGYLWGSTSSGGAYAYGTIFKVNATTGAITTMFDFQDPYGIPGLGSGAGGFALDAKGNLWGATSRGGGYGSGTIFSINRSTGAISALLAIIPALHGSAPGFYFSSDGNLYGTSFAEGQTRAGGAADGSIVRLRFGPTPVTTAATNVTAIGARLNGTLNPNGHASFARFELGTVANLAGSQLFEAGVIPLGAKPVAYGLAVGGLAPATTYYFRARGDNVESTVPQRGAIMSFTTAAR